jgi:hypothetical protein
VVSPLVVVYSVLPVFLLMIAGAVLRRVGMLRQEDDDGIMRLVIHLLLPCLVLDNVLGNRLVRNAAVVGWGLGLGVGLVVSGILIGWLVGGLIGLGRGTGRRTFALSSGMQNFGSTAIPVVEALWPGSGVLGVLFVHNLGVEITMWTMGVMLMAGSRVMPWRNLLNGPVVAIAIGLVLVFSGLDRWVTGPVRVALEWLGAGAFPIGILLTGALMMDFVALERPSLKVALGGSLVRLVVVPLVFLAAAKWLPIIPQLKQVLVVQAAMPSATTPILLAKLYGGRPGIAVQVLVVTTIGCLVTLPLIIALGIAWVGL